MRILDYNILDNNTQICYINRYEIYVSITDYGLKKLLKEVVVSPGQHIWHWIPLKEEKAINLGEEGLTYSSFDEAINREVRDNYAIVYVFENYNEMMKHWNEIVYKDKKLTIYQGADEEK